MAGKTTASENIIFIVILAVVLGVTVGPIVWNHFKKGAVLSKGLDAAAKIISITDTGRRHNTNPVITIKLLVTGQDGSDFEAEITTPMSPVRLAEYKAGAAVKVKYDPDNKKNIAIAGIEQMEK